MQTPTQNSAAASKFYGTKKISTSEFPIPDKYLRLLNEPMIKTPEFEKNLRNDRQRLLVGDLVATPKAVKENAGYLSSNESFSSFNFDDPDNQISKLSDHDRMICHQDFPVLLAYSNQVRGKMTNENELLKKKSIEYSICEAKKMKQRLPVKNLTIFRGQCALTDRKIQDYFSLFQPTPKIRNTSSKTRDGVHMSPAQLFSHVSNNCQEKIPTRQTASLYKKPRLVDPLPSCSLLEGKFRSIVKSKIKFCDSLVDKDLSTPSSEAAVAATANTPFSFKTPKAAIDNRLSSSTVFISNNTESMSEIHSHIRSKATTTGSSTVVRKPSFMAIDERVNEDHRLQNIRKEVDSNKKLLYVSFI
mmetsp:Transcript_319/g.334  ORF Transcript_319/g.334 Transcript_319/m.334 type:complete len:359 (+) Transcript_319:199-1275(+)